MVIWTRGAYGLGEPGCFSFMSFYIACCALCFIFLARGSKHHLEQNLLMLHISSNLELEKLKITS